MSDESATDHAMYEFGLQGRSELSLRIVAIAIGLFSILAILMLKPPFLLWLSLSIAYWGFYAFGLRSFAHHQIFASIADHYIRKINPNYEKDIGRTVESNFLANFVFNKTWKNKPYPKQNRRSALLIICYTFGVGFLWVSASSVDFSNIVIH